MHNCHQFGASDVGKCVTVVFFGASDVQKCVTVVFFEGGLSHGKPHVCNCRHFGASDVRKCVTVVIFPPARRVKDGGQKKYNFFKIWARTLITDHL